MEILSGEEIIKVVDRLVGDVEATGESHTDRQRLENLRKLIDLTDSCLDKIAIASLSSNKSEESMRKIGRHALRYLADSAEWFNAKKRRWDNEYPSD